MAASLTVVLVFGVAPLRRRVLSDPLLRWFRQALPPVSRTEQEALDAGKAICLGPSNDLERASIEFDTAIRGMSGSCAAIEARRRAGRVDGVASTSPIHAAGHAGGIITPAETVLPARYERLRRACIMVDDFAPDVGTRPAETSGAMSAANVMAPASRQVSDRIEETHAE